MKSRFLAASGAILAAILGAVVLFFLNYEDETIAQGRGYGFEVGQSREAAFAAAQALYKAGTFTGMVAKHSGNFTLDDFVVPESEHRGRVWDSEEWVFFYTEPKVFHDSVRLRFESDSVVSIWRYQLPFEHP